MFSLDIPQKVARLALAYRHLPNASECEEKANLAPETAHFHVNIELNVLLLRNKALRPSDLIKDNLIFLARNNDKRPKEGLNVSSTVTQVLFPQQKQSTTGIWNDEVFIVSLRLQLLDFLVSRHDYNDVSVEFVKDENYGMLVLCNIELIDRIERYVKGRFAHEVCKSSPQQEADEDTLELDAILEEIQVIPNDLSISETTLGSEQSSIEKSYVLEDEEEDYESLDELVLVPSTATSQSSDGEALAPKAMDASGLVFDIENGNFATVAAIKHVLNPVPKTSTSPSDTTSMLLRGLPLNSASSSLAGSDDVDTREVGISLDSTTTKKAFLKDMSNLRHNEEYLKLDDIAEVDCSLDSLSKQEVKLFDKDRLGLSALRPPMELRPEEEEIDFSVLVQARKSSFTSPTKKRSVIRRSSSTSFSMINHDDNLDLEYTFRNTSPMVPTYIKEDKKFKFIKVGKVQKFVNLFEEKSSETPEGSRSGTRPSSPAKFDRTVVNPPESDVILSTPTRTT